MTPTDEDAVAMLHDMLAVPSSSGNEERLARLVCNRMTGFGFSARLDEVGNVIGDIGAGVGMTVMLLSHLDTVERPIPVRRSGGGRLHGRGAVDAKGPLAAMICAAARKPGFPGTLRVVAAVEEERLSLGGHHIARTLPEPDLLIIGEPSGSAGVVIGYKGKLDLEYTVTRPPTHSTNPLPKASEVAAAFWQALLDILGPNRDHGAFHQPAATLRAIRGDPVSAWLDIDCRVPPGFDSDGFVAALGGVAGDGELRLVRSIAAVQVSRSNPAARCLSAAIRRHGGKPRPLLKTGTSDMNTVAERWSMPMVAYGPGNSSLDHSDDEYIEIDEYLRGVSVLCSALDELADAEAKPLTGLHSDLGRAVRRRGLPGPGHA